MTILLYFQSKHIYQTIDIRKVEKTNFNFLSFLLGTLVFQVLDNNVFTNSDLNKNLALNRCAFNVKTFWCDKILQLSK